MYIDYHITKIKLLSLENNNDKKGYLELHNLTNMTVLNLLDIFKIYSTVLNDGKINFKSIFVIDKH